MRLVEKKNELVKEYARGAFGYGPIMVIGQSCLGSFGVMYIFMNDLMTRPLQMALVFLITILCLGYNASFLSQQSPIIQLRLLLGSVVMSIVSLLTILFFFT